MLARSGRFRGRIADAAGNFHQSLEDFCPANIIHREINQRTDFARQLSALEVNRAQRSRFAIIPLHHRHQPPSGQRIPHGKARRVGYPEVRCGKLGRGAGGVDVKPPLDRGDDIAAILKEPPAFRLVTVGVDDTGVGMQIGGMTGFAIAC